MPTPVEIAAPRTPTDHEAIKAMMREYAGSLGFSLAYQDFEAELADFPGKYAPPEGALLLATVGGEAAGTVALRRLDATTCEMKRLYVKPAFRGQVQQAPVVCCCQARAAASRASWSTLLPEIRQGRAHRRAAAIPPIRR